MDARELRETFWRDGYVRVPGAVPPEEVSEMRARTVDLLARKGIDLADRSTWPEHVTSLQALRRRDRPPGGVQGVAAALDAVFGPGAWSPKGSWGQVLVTLPTADRWDVPLGWHIDHPWWYPPRQVLACNAFLIIDDLGPRQGATVAVRGSHELVRRFVARTDVRDRKPKVVRKAFERSQPWLAELTRGTGDDRVARFVDAEEVVDDVPVQVVELTGEAGDLHVCHPWLLHAAAPNAADRPRLARVIRPYARREVALAALAGRPGGVAAAGPG